MNYHLNLSQQCHEVAKKANSMYNLKANSIYKYEH